MAFLDIAFGVIKIDKTAGTLVDITGQVKTARGSVEGSNQEFYTLGDFYAHVSDSKKKWSVDITFYASTGANETEALDLFSTWYIGNDRPGNRTLQIDTPDSTTGSFRYSGEVKCTSMSPLFDIDASGGRPQEITVRLMGDGALTKSTIV